jgi:hypothetical protein
LKIRSGYISNNHDQRTIIKFLFNERADACESADRLQAQFDKHTYELRTVRFSIAEVRMGRQGFHDEIRTGKPPLNDLDNKIVPI